MDHESLHISYRGVFKAVARHKFFFSGISISIMNQEVKGETYPGKSRDLESLNRGKKAG
jgi:hypothetical protein